jgi:hypothetical protein
VGSYGKVEIKPKQARNLGNGRMMQLHQYIVIWDGRQVGIKSKHFNAPIQWTSKIPSEIRDWVVSEVNELLGESVRSGNMIGVWDHELKPTEPTIQGEDLDEIFN